MADPVGADQEVHTGRVTFALVGFGYGAAGFRAEGDQHGHREVPGQLAPGRSGSDIRATRPSPIPTPAMMAVRVRRPDRLTSSVPAPRLLTSPGRAANGLLTRLRLRANQGSTTGQLVRSESP
jgi:hypothetical protein